MRILPAYNQKPSGYEPFRSSFRKEFHSRKALEISFWQNRANFSFLPRTDSKILDSVTSGSCLPSVGRALRTANAVSRRLAATAVQQTPSPVGWSRPPYGKRRLPSVGSVRQMPFSRQ